MESQYLEKKQIENDAQYDCNNKSKSEQILCHLMIIVSNVDVAD